MGICKLCNEERKLIKKSHIISKFMYQDLYDKNNKPYKFSPNLMALGDHRKLRPSSGEYDSDLLCEKCDNVVIGKYEYYASKALYGGKLPINESPVFNNYINLQDVEFIHCKNINYNKFKLFLLSILWRASISKRNLFSDVDLGIHEDTIRKMIFLNNPKNIDEYPILLLTYLNDETVYNNIIVQPRIIKEDGRTMYAFIIAGVVYIFHISRNNIPEIFINSTINSNNEMKILHFPKGRGKNFIERVCSLI